MRLAFAGFRHPHILSLYRDARAAKDVEIIGCFEENADVRASLIREEGIVEVYNGTETETDSWKPTDQGIMLRLINGTEYAMFSEDGRLILEMQDVKFTFEKQQ